MSELFSVFSMKGGDPHEGMATDDQILALKGPLKQNSFSDRVEETAAPATE
jgi:hypothetical protein